MNKSPNLFTLKNLFEHCSTTRTQIKEGCWVPARPLGLYSFHNRLRLALGVFTGKYDALKWPGGQ